jgi:hypothetical protein
MDIKKAATSREKNIHKFLALTGQEFVPAHPSLWVREKNYKMRKALSNSDIHTLLNQKESIELASKYNVIALVIHGWTSSTPDPSMNGMNSRMTIVGSPDGWYTIMRNSDEPLLQQHDARTTTSAIHELLMELISTAQTTRRI